MGKRIKDAEHIEELKDYLMLPVGNTDGGEDGEITLGQVKDYTDADKSQVAFTGSYLNLTDTPNLNEYVLMTTLNQNYYNRNQVNQLIGGVTGPKFEKVEELPEEGDNNVIYLLPQQGGGYSNMFDEYVWLPDGLVFEKIGSTQANFDNYYDKEEVEAMIPAVGNGTITINQGGVLKGTFTVNQTGNTTINLEEGSLQEQADWDEADPTAVDFIKNKPVIPTVNNPEITITQGGVTKGVITLNQSEAQTISLDAGGGSGSQVQSDWDEEDNTDVSYIQNKPDVISLVFEYDNGIVEDVELYVKSRDSHRDYLWVKNRYAGSNTLTLSTASSYSPEYHAESVEYSKDKENWTLLELEAGVTHTIQMEENEVVYFRNDSGHWNYYNGAARWYTSISCSQPHDAGGDPYSLVDYTATDITGFSDYGIVNGIFDSDTNLVRADKIKILDVVSLSYNYYKMFYGCTSLTTIPQTLPVTTLAIGCYQSMFQGCTSLTSTPQLPATTLAYNCYYQMFQGCTSLTSTPQLPATTLTQSCYYKMFQGCTSLTSAPSLPATTLEHNCYAGMFQGCTSLTSAPQLPATTLATQCYQEMFRNCTSLTSAPQLPATTLATQCYYGMFNGCTSLTSAPALQAATLTEQCYQEMFRGCTSLTSAPALPATTLAQSCYSQMFQGCTSLTTPQQTLPATTLALGCYFSMFYNCTSLTTAPALPATTLTNKCYYEMFNGCTSLTTAPTIQATTAANECCRGMFQGCTSLTTVQQTLQVTTLANKCFMRMFNGCSALTTLPELPATTVADYCYQDMFAYCTSLTTPQQTLPATTLATGCYSGMFNTCTGLTSSPQLPATTLATQCYYGMFTSCRSLTTPPALPATTLADYCYGSMFYNCTSLTSSPALPVTTLLDYCYYEMFRNCTSLNDVTIYADDISATDCIKDWLKSVAATGTLHNLGSAVYPSGDSGIPTGWTETNS